MRFNLRQEELKFYSIDKQYDILKMVQDQYLINVSSELDLDISNAEGHDKDGIPDAEINGNNDINVTDVASIEN